MPQSLLRHSAEIRWGRLSSCHSHLLEIFLQEISSWQLHEGKVLHDAVTEKFLFVPCWL